MKKAALLDSNNNVIGEVLDAPERQNFVEVAASFTSDGYPINVRAYKISRSKENMEKAKFEDLVFKRECKHGDVYEF
jgi:hypothetical protein